MITALEVIDRINCAATKGMPFLFGVDYELENGFFIEHPLDDTSLMWRVGKYTNVSTQTTCSQKAGTYLHKYPVSFDAYKQKFDALQAEQLQGNSFLANLTIQTPIETDYALEELFLRSNSPYALLIPNQLVCFSPETFIKVANGKISSNPMKGTISASIPNAEAQILSDYKEQAEHFTIVDFIRNDLSRVAEQVRVENLRYIDRLQTSNGELLQVSSLITGCLNKIKLGDMLFELLPAGSISGAPKKSTVNLLQRIEKQKRGFYTGVFGYFDGKDLDTSVMIRYIEQLDDQLFFRSGGGITVNSNVQCEYQEVIDKIYLPFV